MKGYLEFNSLGSEDKTYSTEPTIQGSAPLRGSDAEKSKSFKKEDKKPDPKAGPFTSKFREESTAPKGVKGWIYDKTGVAIGKNAKITKKNAAIRMGKLKKLGISAAEDDKRIRENHSSKTIRQSINKGAALHGAGGAVVGGAAGYGVGHLLVTKSRKQLAALVAKPTKSEHDEKEIKRLKRKIAIAKGVGAGVGAIGGGVYTSTRKMKQNVGKLSAEEQAFRRTDAYRANQQRTSLNTK